MTQRTINLYDGLEALYYLDSDYFDSGSNELKDKSGHGLHAEAEGGPTVGVAGPGEFEATEFDGSDDVLVRQADVMTEDEFTAFGILRVNDVVGNGGTITTSSGGNNTVSDGWELGQVNETNDRFNVVIRDNDAPGGQRRVLTRNLSDSIGEWFRVSLTFDSSEGIARAYYGFDAELSSRGPQAVSEYTSNDTMRFAMRGSGNPVDCTVAVGSFWSRVLNQSELKLVHKLTGPRRAQL